MHRINAFETQLIMKKLICQSLQTLFLFLFLSTPLRAENGSSLDSVEVSTKDQAAWVYALSARVEEIKAMDISAMDATEKKQLRKELYSIKKELKGQKKTATTGITKSALLLIRRFFLLILNIRINFRLRSILT